MGYLVRRLLENTSNEGFLRQSSFEKTSATLLLRTPVFDELDTGEKHLEDRLPNQESGFVNEPLIDFTIESQRIKAVDEIELLRKSTAREVTSIIAGSEITSKDIIESTSPEDSNLVLAKINLASLDTAEAALESLNDYFPRWRETPLSQRTLLLQTAAQKMRERRFELIAAIVLESGKPIVDADGDVAEAIDFCEYYALEAQRVLRPTKLMSPAGEINSLWQTPRGVTAVISPWNFPLAIPCGMFAASIVCGNCVILKPAEQSSLVAALLFEIFLESGMPPEAAAFIPGRGEDVGKLLSTHKSVASICFTGSKTVGLALIEDGAKSETFGRHVRKVVSEMGGKNSIVVDEDADLDEAVKGVVYSTFGFAGQKCSACSVVHVVGSAYERFTQRLKEAVASLHVGAASDVTTFVGPVIDQEAKNRLDSAIEDAKADCQILVEHSFDPNSKANGHFVAPIVFTDVPEGHALRSNELFGPVLVVEFADTFEDALCAAQETEYALTGAVFSRSPKNIEYAVNQFRVGNLYLNRGSTGALVGRQPFGGAAMSGVGSKAGGPEYLLQFVIPRATSENTLRRGFAPIE
ncbi:UNVERIFIED_CONTAM: hypothetical protein GTU68_058644 [Idotea baltica]|nr:hypothetical protein [Idotea baltica]